MISMSVPRCVEISAESTGTLTTTMASSLCVIGSVLLSLRMSSAFSSG